VKKLSKGLQRRKARHVVNICFYRNRIIWSARPDVSTFGAYVVLMSRLAEYLKNLRFSVKYFVTVNLQFGILVIAGS